MNAPATTHDAAVERPYGPSDSFSRPEGGHDGHARNGSRRDPDRRAARPLRRAGTRLRRRQPLLPGGLRRASRGGLPRPGDPAGLRRAGADARPGGTAAAPARLRRPRDGGRDQHAPLRDGVAAELYRTGDASLAWLLEEAAAGHVFA